MSAVRQSYGKPLRIGNISQLFSFILISCCFKGIQSQVHNLSTMEVLSESGEKAIQRDFKLVNERIYTYLSMCLVLLMFFNLGTILDLKRIRTILFKPIGPVVGFCARYAVMPCIALGLGKLCFSSAQAHLQLALLFTAVAPSGGLANIANIFVKGNINLSIATTIVNSLLALALLPLWILEIAPQVIPSDDGVLYDVPYVKLIVGAVALILALGLGLALKFCIPKITRLMYLILKPLSIVLSLCLIGVAVGLHPLIVTWKIALAALFLPILGYLLTYLLSKILCRNATDSMTISVETSIMNMTFPIFLLRMNLPDEKVQYAVAIPIMSSLISLGLFVIFYVIRKIFGFNKKQNDEAFDVKDMLNESDAK